MMAVWLCLRPLLAERGCFRYMLREKREVRGVKVVVSPAEIGKAVAEV